MKEILIDTLIDNAKLFPFLFVTYVILEYLEHKTTNKTTEIIKKADKAGPLIGSLFGILPQCGFSVVAANFYAARLITLGTLVAIFLSTSDETLPILISHAVSAGLIAKIIGYKFLCGLLFGFLIDLLNRKYRLQPAEPLNIEQLCEEGKCHCAHNIWRPALYHSVKITLFIFVITLILNLTMNSLSAKYDWSSWLRIPLFGELISGLVGLIPNCSPSVLLTQLYLDHYINIGTMMSGSLVSGGVGLLVLFRINRHLKQNLQITGILYICGVLGGLISNWFDF